MSYEKSDKFTQREKIALRYADAIMYEPAQADDAMWVDLHAEFTEPELVELGSFVALTFGQQRWIKTLGIGHGEVLGDTSEGLWREKVEEDAGQDYR